MYLAKPNYHSACAAHIKLMFCCGGSVGIPSGIRGKGGIFAVGIGSLFILLPEGISRTLFCDDWPV